MRSSAGSSGRRRRSRTTATRRSTSTSTRPSGATGSGTDAVRTLARHLFTVHGHHRIEIDPAADNHAAIRAYSKVGFRPVGITRRSERGADGTWHDSAAHGPARRGAGRRAGRRSTRPVVIGVDRRVRSGGNLPGWCRSDRIPFVVGSEAPERPMPRRHHAVRTVDLRRGEAPGGDVGGRGRGPDGRLHGLRRGDGRPGRAPGRRAPPAGRRPRRPSRCATARCSRPTVPSPRRRSRSGGFYLVECEDLDEAIEVAAKIPGATHGSIEVRPIWEM